MRYQLEDQVAILDIDDGKANVFGHDLIDTMLSALDQAEQEAKAVIIKGRDGIFSAGFDLKEIEKGKKEAGQLLIRGMQLLTRLYAHPQPVIAQCEGHAMGIGAFILLACDSRVASNGEYVVCLPETKIGMAFTPVLLEFIRAKIPTEKQTQCALQSQSLNAKQAMAAGFIDQLSDSVEQDVKLIAQQLIELPAKFYAKNKQDLRASSIVFMQNSINDIECLDIRQ